MGDLDEILKKFNKWIVPILNKLNVKIRQEASGFANTWSGLQEIKSVMNSGFNVKIREERSGFVNTWSGLRSIETDVEALQTITDSGLDTLHNDLLKKQREELSGFTNTWSGLTEIRDEIIQLQDINRSGFTECPSGVEGFFKVVGADLSGVIMASGAYTDALWTRGFNDKSFYWYSANSSGTMTIQVGDPNGNFYGYDSKAFTTGALTSYIMTGQAGRIRLRNEVAMSGTIRAWYVMRCG